MHRLPLLVTALPISQVRRTEARGNKYRAKFSIWQGSEKGLNPQPSESFQNALTKTPHPGWLMKSWHVLLTVWRLEREESQGTAASASGRGPLLVPKMAPSCQPLCVEEQAGALGPL